MVHATVVTLETALPPLTKGYTAPAFSPLSRELTLTSTFSSP